MQFWFHFICMTWIIKCGLATSSDSMFSVMALGPSALFINWDPLDFTKEPYYMSLDFNCSIKENVNKKVNSSIRSMQPVSNGQTKIPNLLENTTYQIQISVIDYKINRVENATKSKKKKVLHSYYIEGTTKIKIYSPPAKPDFFIKTGLSLFIIIYWLPCGQTRNCQGLEPGTHFYVTYKALESRNTIRISVIEQDFVKIPYTELVPGKTWEVIVTSVNGNYETKSDLQEIFTIPIASPVQSVAVDFTNRTINSSVIISWRSPQQTSEAIESYYVCFQPTKLSKIMWNDYDWEKFLHYYHHPMRVFVTKEDVANSHALKMEIANVQHTNHGNLQRATNYSFFIIPTTVDSLHHIGFIYEFQYTTP